MIPAWANSLIGIPYKLKGRTESGCDCYGLAILTYRKMLGISLQEELQYPDDPDFSEEAQVAIDSHTRSFFQKVDKPEIFDLAIFKIYGIRSHVGIMINDSQFLHTYAGIDSNIGNLGDKNWERRFDGFYRYSRE